MLRIRTAPKTPRVHLFEGSQVVDAGAPVDVTVTPHDIASSRSKAPNNCAVAKACKRLQEVEDVRVHLTRTFLKVGNRWYRFRTPTAIRQEIIAFDRGGSFEPGTYTLLPVPTTDRLGNSRNKSPGPKLTKGKKRHVVHAVANVRQRART